MPRRAGHLAPAVESVKKGVLKVDLQALTVGVAVLSMAAWLSGARDSVLHDAEPSLDASRKLAIVNGLAEQTRAQVRSASALRGQRCLACWRAEGPLLAEQTRALVRMAGALPGHLWPSMCGPAAAGQCAMRLLLPG